MKGTWWSFTAIQITCSHAVEQSGCYKRYLSNFFYLIQKCEPLQEQIQAFLKIGPKWWGGGCKPRWALNSLHGILQYSGHLISLTGSAPWCLIVFSLWHEPKSYMFMMCHTFPQFLSLCCLLALVTCSGPDGGDFLSLPQSWRPRALLFVIVWTSLTGLSLWGVKVMGLDQMLPISWWLLVRFSFWIENSLLLYFLQSD